MAVTRKPSSLPSSPPADVEAFIRGGGSEPREVEGTTGDVVEGKAEVQVVTLRLPVELLKEVDGQRKQRRPSPSRHQWLLEAVYEKIEREAGEVG